MYTIHTTNSVANSFCSIIIDSCLYLLRTLLVRSQSRRQFGQSIRTRCHSASLFVAFTGSSTRQQKSQSVYSQAFQYLMVFSTLRINSARLIVHNTISFSLMVHGFCPNCSLLVSLFVPAIQLFRIQRTNSQLIHRNSRTILSIAVTWLAFPVILFGTTCVCCQFFATFQTGILVVWLLYLLRALRPPRSYTLCMCGVLVWFRREPFPLLQEGVLFTPCLLGWFVGVCFWHKSMFLRVPRPRTLAASCHPVGLLCGFFEVVK